MWKQGETRETLMVYYNAMKNVTSDDKLFHQLESSKPYVEKQLNKQVGIFLPKLPYDIVDRILSQLYLRDLLKCRSICKQWNKMISRWPKLWKNVNCEWLQSSTLPLLMSKPLREVSVLCDQDEDNTVPLWEAFEDYPIAGIKKL